MNLDAVISAYRRYARIYDLVFGPIFEPGRKGIIDALDFNPGDDILEVGVGTGLSLALYPDDVQVTGIDVSHEMLEKARGRVGGHPRRTIMEMDGEQMSFPSDHFDKVVAMYVVSVAPHPEKLMEEVERVCKPGGDIFIVNHFRSSHPVIRGAENLMAPLSKLAGFRPDFDLDDFLKTTGLEVVDIQSANLFGYWKLLHCKNRAAAPAAA
ncbi:MAG TPA: class I SAM-dependent methyltransferase [Gammaproteobacteria bacterium]|nr:class I SAM-dependent methyltransferase [Gammaproteobacteria bacterium]